MSTVVETEPTTSTGAPPEPMRQHVVERVPGGGHQERTLCGKLWDRADLKPMGELCEGCAEELRRRGQGHLIPFIGRGPGGGD